MPAGVEIKNDAGFIQIDDSNKNYVFKSKGTGTCNNSIGGDVAIYSASIAVTSNSGAPLMAFRATSDFVGFIGTTVSGSTYTFHFVSNTNGTTFDWFHFDEPDAGASPENIGFEIFTAASARAYHSALKPIRIVDVLNAAVDGSYTSGRTYAAIQNADGYRWTETAPVGMGAGNFRAWQAGAKWTAEAIDTSWPSALPAAGNGVRISDLSSGSVTQSYTPQTPKFLIIDVTGY